VVATPSSGSSRSAGKQTVTCRDRSISVRLIAFAVHRRNRWIIAPVIRMRGARRDVVLGAAYIRRTGPKPSDLDARSAICPHLGCAVNWDVAKGNYLCPCHDSRFAVTGEKLSGPSERGLDQLELKTVDGRLKLTWVLYKTGRTTPEPA
jgi:Rieske Fe-S protein